MLKVNLENSTLRLTGDVGYPDGFDAEQLEDALTELGGRDFSFILRSDGGVITEGLSCYNQLRDYPGYIKGHVDVKAHSIASVVMLGADYLSASENASFLLHNAWTIAMGSAAELREVADALEMAEKDILQAYASTSGKDEAFWQETINSSTTLNPKEALEVGLIDGIRETPAKKAAPKSLAQIKEAQDLVAHSRSIMAGLATQL